VAENILLVSHVWPGITPMNVLEMRYDYWCLYVEAAKQWASSRG
jgi:hypothetical protein